MIASTQTHNLPPQPQSNKMSTNYKPSNQTGNPFANGGIGMIVTIAIFMALPLMSILSDVVQKTNVIQVADNAEPPPPPPPDELPPPPEEEEEQEKPEMEEPPPPMTLTQLELALNPGAGNAAGDFGFGDFNTGIDALADMQIFDLQDLDKQPRPLFQIKPVYPYSLKQAQVQGWVQVEWVIDPQGRVLRPRAVKSTHREFEQPAVEAIMRSKWQPGKKDGKNVAVRVRQRIDFTL